MNLRKDHSHLFQLKNVEPLWSAIAVYAVMTGRGNLNRSLSGLRRRRQICSIIFFAVDSCTGYTWADQHSLTWHECVNQYTAVEGSLCLHRLSIRVRRWYSELSLYCRTFLDQWKMAVSNRRHSIQYLSIIHQAVRNLYSISKLLSVQGQNCTTFSSGYLGYHNDEERSETRY